MSNFVGLIVLDGFGLNNNKYGNAIKQANPVNFLRYFKECPSSKLSASGESVGLSKGQMGGSEVGHMHMGAGRVIDQVSRMISKSIKNGEFYKNEQLIKACRYANDNDSSLHILGVLSDGGVHSHIDHMLATIELAHRQEVKRVYLHCFLDGRDTYREDGVKYLQKLLKFIEKYKDMEVKVSTLMGRYYAMDREQNYDRTKKAYKAMVLGNAEYYATDPGLAVNDSYKKGVYDEFVEPIAINHNGNVNTIKDYDAVIFTNYREDRARQLTASLIEKFDRFETVDLSHLYFCGFSNYDKTFKNLKVAFPEKEVQVNLSQIISTHGLRQFKIAETTKYAHVTYFFNGGIEKPYKGESRFLIETIKNIPFDKAPQMRAKEITDKAIEEIKSQKYSFMLLNYSNCDMVGHTGNLESAITAVQVVDKQLKRVVDEIVSIGGVAIITADHGNAEAMLDKDGKVLTDHTLNKVPFIIVNKEGIRCKDGTLANVAPTVLELMGLEKPKEFTENSLVEYV